MVDCSRGKRKNRFGLKNTHIHTSVRNKMLSQNTHDQWLWNQKVLAVSMNIYTDIRLERKFPKSTCTSALEVKNRFIGRIKDQTGACKQEEKTIHQRQLKGCKCFKEAETKYRKQKPRCYVYDTSLAETLKYSGYSFCLDITANLPGIGLWLWPKSQDWTSEKGRSKIWHDL